MKTTVLADYHPTDYKIFFIHQTDERGFNRGAMKNIGFIHVKNTYPNDYKNITLVFNDIDIVPVNKGLVDYETVPGLIKHFYGFNYALGGMFSITAGDFENINGFPNYWGWGYEDNLINARGLQAKLTIDRSQFYEIFDKNFIYIFDKNIRTSNKSDFIKYIKNTPDGINTIYNLQYQLVNDSFLSGEQVDKNFIDVVLFETPYPENKDTIFNYDFKDGAKPFVEVKNSFLKQNKKNQRMKMAF